MRKLIAVLALSLASVGASADQYRHHGHGGHRGAHHASRADWVAPLIVGGVITYALTRPAQPVIVQQQPQVVYQTQTPIGYHYENILDANCNCYRLVLVQN